MKKILLILTLLLVNIAGMTAAASPYVTTANLNMRALPCTCSEIITTIPKGSKVDLLNWEDDTWSRVEYNGYVYFVATRYLVPKTEYNPYTTYNHHNYKSGYYINIDGDRVQRPEYRQTAPADATAICRDGTYSYSKHRKGTCSHHGGVRRWL